MPCSSKRKPPTVAEEIVGRRVVGHVEVDPAVAVEVGRDHAQSSPVAIDDARRGRHVDEPAAIVAKDVIGQRREVARIAVVGRRVLGIDADRVVVHVPGEVVADVEVEIAVVVEVGERGGGRPVAIAGQAGLLGHVLEPAIAPVAEQGIGAPAREEEVGPAVVVEVGHRDPMAVASDHGRRCQPAR